MSRAYTCWIEKSNDEKIKEETQDQMEEYCGDVTLYGGESDSEYSERIVKQLWELEGRYVNFKIQMTYLEDLPYEDYEYDKDEYLEIMEIEDD